jgi:hypothetical protein
MTQPAGRDFYDRQIRYLADKDVDGLVANQYADDAEIVSFGVVKKGREALLDHFRGYLDHLGSIELLSTDNFQATEDSIFFEATVRTGTYGVVRVYDVWVLADGRIARHFTGRLS